MSKGRINREQKTIEKMLAIYCRDKHGTQKLCPDCRDLQNYAMERITRCKFADQKTSCGKCTVHCYRKEVREKIVQVMRYAGPKMLFHHPVLAVYHLIDSLKKNPIKRM